MNEYQMLRDKYDEIGKIVEDIKGIVAVLDPKGAAWAEEMKRERNAQVHPVMRGIVNNIGRGRV